MNKHRLWSNARSRLIIYARDVLGTLEGGIRRERKMPHLVRCRHNVFWPFWKAKTSVGLTQINDWNEVKCSKRQNFIDKTMDAVLSGQIKCLWKHSEPQIPMPGCEILTRLKQVISPTSKKRGLLFSLQISDVIWMSTVTRIIYPNTFPTLIYLPNNSRIFSPLQSWSKNQLK